MSQAMTTLLSVALLSAVFTGTLGQNPPPPPRPPPPYAYPPPPYYGNYPPPPYGVYSPPPRAPYPPPASPAPVQTPPAPVPPAGNGNFTGFARFVGPLSAGCQVVYDYGNGTTVAAAPSTIGQVSVGPLQPVRVLPGAGCTDTFTGVPIPFSAGGDSLSNSSFQVSVTNMIALVDRALGATAASSYAKIGVRGAGRLETSDLYAILRTGNSTAWTMLTADVAVILATTTMAQSFIAATNASAAGNRCPTVDSAARAFAVYINNMTTSSWNVNDAARSMIATCNVTGANLTAITAPANTIWTALSPLVPTLNEPQPFALPYFASWASWLSTVTLAQLSTLASLNASARATALESGLNAVPIVTSAIAAQLGVPATPDQSTTLSVILVGPISGAAVSTEPWYNSVKTALANTTGNADSTAATTTNPKGTFAIYNVSGGTDLFLTGDPTKPVLSVLSYSGAVGFTNGSGAVTLGPITCLAGSAWYIQQTTLPNNTQFDLPVPAAIGSNTFLTAYQTIVGPGLLDTTVNYMQRSFEAGSKTQLFVYMADAVVAGTVGLISAFINGAVAGQNIRWSATDITNNVFVQFIGSGQANYTSPQFLYNVTQAVFNATGANITALPSTPASTPPAPYGAYPPPPYGRPGYPPSYPATYPPPPAAVPSRADFNTIVERFTGSVAASNGLIFEYTGVIAGSSTGRRLLQNSNPAIGVSQVAAVQQSDMMAAAQAIADAIRSGNLASALALSQSFATQFTGSSLRSLVNSKVVNTAAINAATTPSSPSSSSSSNKVALGVGIGVGLGVPVLAALIAGVVLFIKKRREGQATAPAATAEGAMLNAADYAGVGEPTQEGARITQFFRTRVAASGYSRPAHM